MLKYSVVEDPACIGDFSTIKNNNKNFYFSRENFRTLFFNFFLIFNFLKKLFFKIIFQYSWYHKKIPSIFDEKNFRNFEVYQNLLNYLS